MTNRRLQGMSAMGMLFLLIAVGIGASLGLKIGPHYMNHNTIQGLISALTAEEAKAGRPALMETLRKRFKINALYDLEPDKIIRYKRERGTTSITIDYEIREHLGGNVYVLLDFDETRTF
jgi:hypothetical protein